MATALWSSGELAIAERRNFQRVFDLTERVIPDQWRRNPPTERLAIQQLLLQALQGHGWATTGTLAQTWRLKNLQQSIGRALKRLTENGDILACSLVDRYGNKKSGWIRPQDLSLAERLGRTRPRRDKGVLLSPFDPLIWDRGRVRQLFDFDQILEIFKPAPKRKYGYYCLPVLAGENLVARVDLKADTKQNKLKVLSCHYEAEQKSGKIPSVDREAVHSALERYAGALKLKLEIGI